MFFYLCKKKLKMGYEAAKLELIEWLSKLEDPETIDYLKIVKDSRTPERDWWHDLTDRQKAGIARGLKDIDEGRITPHEVIKQRFGL